MACNPWRPSPSVDTVAESMAPGEACLGSLVDGPAGSAAGRRHGRLKGRRRKGRQSGQEQGIGDPSAKWIGPGFQHGSALGFSNQTLAGAMRVLIRRNSQTLMRPGPVSRLRSIERIPRIHGQG